MQKRKPLSSRNRRLLPPEIAETVRDMDKSCNGKFRHELGLDADAAARDNSLDHPGEYFIAYRCRYAPHFHVGHATFSDYVEIGGQIENARPVWLNGVPLTPEETAAMAVRSSDGGGPSRRRTFDPSSARVGDRVPPMFLAGWGKMYRMAGSNYVDGPNGESFILSGQDYERVR